MSLYERIKELWGQIDQGHWEGDNDYSIDSDKEFHTRPDGSRYQVSVPIGMVDAENQHDYDHESGESAKADALMMWFLEVHNNFPSVLSALKGQEWLPIESCPKGGDYILVRLADRLVEEGDSPVALVRHLAEVWFESDGGVEYDLSQLTHWRPLPPTPELTDYQKKVWHEAMGEVTP